jgi:hypothetical protein
MPKDQDGGAGSISLAGEVRGQIFVWVGIVGGALTLVNHWSNFITLADWMRWIVEHWTALLHQFWTAIGQMLHVRISKDTTVALSYYAFISSITLGSLLRGGVRIIEKKCIGRAFLYLVLLALFAYLLRHIGIVLPEYDLWRYFVLFAVTTGLVNDRLMHRLYAGVVYTLAIFSISKYISTTAALTLPNDTAKSVPFNDWWLPTIITVLFMFSIIAPIVLAPTRYLIKRLTFLLIGVAIIFGLSYVSNFIQFWRILFGGIEF